MSADRPGLGDRFACARCGKLGATRVLGCGLCWTCEGDLRAERRRLRSFLADVGIEMAPWQLDFLEAILCQGQLDKEPPTSGGDSC